MMSREQSNVRQGGRISRKEFERIGEKMNYMKIQMDLLKALEVGMKHIIKVMATKHSECNGDSQEISITTICMNMKSAKALAACYEEQGYKAVVIWQRA